MFSHSPSCSSLILPPEVQVTFSSSHLLLYVTPSEPQTGLYSRVQSIGQSLWQQSSVESKLEYPALSQLSFPHLRSPSQSSSLSQSPSPARQGEPLEQQSSPPMHVAPDRRSSIT